MFVSGSGYFLLYFSVDDVKKYKDEDASIILNTLFGKSPKK
jgi:hypothetical protein